MVQGKKIVNQQELQSMVNYWRKNGETIVFTNGVFDILHRGHLISFELAAGFGDRLVVGVNSDESARSLSKGPDRPFVSQNDRVSLVAAFGLVDAAILFSEETPLDLIALIKPDVLLKGEDYAIDQIVGREFAARVERAPILPGYSSSIIIDRIQNSREEAS
ncbi:MAG: adenylyltransferase/cytidyltransferase family protein [Calditrichaeota bacterium]|nr:adenylyltransferase/cytidyltransferase family protein [Calditrichota bacterium]MBT7788952.1 adenylyltransferase/cytidyltransferase family protein [Calditrichota bacterium]